MYVKVFIFPWLIFKHSYNPLKPFFSCFHFDGMKCVFPCIILNYSPHSSFPNFQILYIKIISTIHYCAFFIISNLFFVFSIRKTNGKYSKCSVIHENLKFTYNPACRKEYLDLKKRLPRTVLEECIVELATSTTKT